MDEEKSTELVTERYPAEVLSEDYDDGTMPSSLESLREAVVGHKIVEVKKGRFKRKDAWREEDGLALLLDNGSIVWMAEEGDCCAYTEVDSTTIMKHIDQIDHVITGVGTTDGFNTWHIYADLGDVLEFQVGWSAGNIGYYAYGFNITVFEPGANELAESFKEITN